MKRLVEYNAMLGKRFAGAELKAVTITGPRFAIDLKISSMRLRANYAAEAEMASGRIDWLGHARRGPITPAIIRRTEK